MFDHYRPDPALACPACGAELDGWQGKDGPCGLFVWRQGHAAPVDQEVPDESKGLSDVVAGLRLPESFEIYTQCCGGSFFITAEGSTTDGVWTATVLETAHTATQRPNERKEDFKRRLAWLRGERARRAPAPLPVPPQTLTPAQVSTVLQRAAEIDAGGDTLTVAELVKIADEAGIDRAATAAALQEVFQEGDAPTSVTSPTSGALVKAGRDTMLQSMGLASLAGALLGWISWGPDEAAILSVGGLSLYMLFQAVRSMKRKAQLEFQLQNFTGWFVATVLAAVAPGLVFLDDILAVALPAWLAVAIVGGVLIRFGPGGEEEEESEVTRLKSP